MSRDTDCRRITRRTFSTTTSSTLRGVVVEAIADHKEINELDPDFSLYEEINIESLNELVCSRSLTNLQIEFQLDDAVVEVQQNTETEFCIAVTDSERGS